MDVCQNNVTKKRGASCKIAGHVPQASYGALVWGFCRKGSMASEGMSNDLMPQEVALHLFSEAGRNGHGDLLRTLANRMQGTLLRGSDPPDAISAKSGVASHLLEPRAEPFQPAKSKSCARGVSPRAAIPGLAF